MISAETLERARAMALVRQLEAAMRYLNDGQLGRYEEAIMLLEELAHTEALVADAEATT